MSRIGKIARRTFLVGSLAVAGGVAFGIYKLRETPPNPLSPGEGAAALNSFVIVDGDGVTLVAPKAEMGQGVHTTWAALIAEELDVELADVTLIHGPPAKAYFNSSLMAEGLPNKGYDASSFAHMLGEVMGQAGKFLNLQVTGGSTSMTDGYERMRVAGATARETLKEAAAQRLGVSRADLTTEAGQVIAPDGTAIPYAELAMAAAEIDPPHVELRPPSRWRLLGKTQPRVDMLGKATGTAEFAIDVRRESMKFATLRINPKLGGTMISADTSAAEGMPGVEKVIRFENGIAVVARNTWLAIQAAEAAEIEWGAAPYPPEMDGILATLDAAFQAEPNSTLRDDGDADTLPAGATEVTAEYDTPFLAHSTMEPMNATALFTGDALEVWSGNQAPIFTRRVCAEAAGLDEDAVTLHTTLMGGGFGRRGELDFSRYAAMVAREMPDVPVQVTWSREEDMRHDFYRPATKARFRGAVQDGKAVLIDGAIAGPSITQQAMGRWLGLSPGGPDKGHVDGAFNQPYAVPNFRIRGHLADLDVPIGFWRSVGASHNAFYLDSFMDELALAAGRDPLDFRLAHARDAFAPAAAVLERVGEMSGWTGQTAEGIGRGVGFCYAFGTPVAMVIEVADEDGAIRIAKAWIAADLGTALDPGNLEAQMTGGMIYGLSAAVMGEITFSDGEVQQRNFPDYDALRIHTVPETAVAILETNPHMGGAGEPSTPPAAPALANAIFDLTGTRARSLPLNKQFTFVI